MRALGHCNRQLCNWKTLGWATERTEGAKTIQWTEIGWKCKKKRHRDARSASTVSTTTHANPSYTLSGHYLCSRIRIPKPPSIISFHTLYQCQRRWSSWLAANQPGWPCTTPSLMDLSLLLEGWPHLAVWGWVVLLYIRAFCLWCLQSYFQSHELA